MIESQGGHGAMEQWRRIRYSASEDGSKWRTSIRENYLNWISFDTEKLNQDMCICVNFACRRWCGCFETLEEVPYILS